MSASRTISQQQWVGINYGLMLLSLIIPVMVLLPAVISIYLLNQPQDVWLRSHLLWVMRSSVGFGVFILLAVLLIAPLLWWPYQHGKGFILLMAAGGITALVGWLWLLYRSVKGLQAFIKGKAVY